MQKGTRRQLLLIVDGIDMVRQRGQQRKKNNYKYSL
jgi:hypothetical protein